MAAPFLWQIIMRTTQPPGIDQNSLSSHWDGLSPHLIASFYEVKKTNNNVWVRTPDADRKTVYAPLIDANIEISLDWQSAFEHTGPENRAPTLLAMLQSGALQPIIDAFIGGGKDAGSLAAQAQQRSNDFIRQFEGRTGITRLNSTQIFNGMRPVKIHATAIFRAWSDPIKEVEEPFNKLMEWALPVKLSPDGSVLARSAQAARGESNFIDALVPSLAPIMVAMNYKGEIYSPLVIESINNPISSPVDSRGRYIEKSVQMSLATLTAIDREDWSNYRTVRL